jgi:hypothetical protein
MENDIEREILLHAIDVLTMDVLRLKSENETLRSSLDQTKFAKRSRRPGNENILSKGLAYLRREGFVRTLKKAAKKLQKSFRG